MAGGRPVLPPGRQRQRVLRETVDEFVLHQIAREIRGKEFVGKLVVQAAHEMADEPLRKQARPELLSIRQPT